MYFYSPPHFGAVLFCGFAVERLELTARCCDSGHSAQASAHKIVNSESHGPVDAVAQRAMHVLFGVISGPRTNRDPRRQFPKSDGDSCRRLR